MNLLLKNFLVLVLVMFLFVALGQWNHQHFQQKAYSRAKELIMLDFSAKGGKNGKFIEPTDIFSDPIRIGLTAGDGGEYLYDVGITNHLLVQFSALNLFFSPKVQVTAVETSQP
ncbi:MAG: hypothetical protein RRA32_10150 [bacterium]|nr:hypothetical protein [bacterium]